MNFSYKIHSYRPCFFYFHCTLPFRFLHLSFRSHILHCLSSRTSSLRLVSRSSFRVNRHKRRILSFKLLIGYLLIQYHRNLFKQEAAAWIMGCKQFFPYFMFLLVSLINPIHHCIKLCLSV